MDLHIIFVNEKENAQLLIRATNLKAGSVNSQCP